MHEWPNLDGQGWGSPPPTSPPSYPQPSAASELESSQRTRLEMIVWFLQQTMQDRLTAKARAIAAINERLTAGDQRVNAHQSRLLEHDTKLDRHAEKLDGHEKQLAELAETKRTVDEVRRSITMAAGSRNIIVGMVALWALASGKVSVDKLIELWKAVGH